MVSSRLVNLEGLPLMAFIPTLSPELVAPVHLTEWCDLIERALHGGVRAVCSIPVRHHKTVTTLHGVAWLLVQRPSIRVILMCADHERSLELGKHCRRLCEAAGIGPVRGENTIVDWKNDHGGGVCVMSAEQSRLGRDVDVLIFDDPITEKTADDPTVREDVDHSIAHYTARAKMGAGPGSVLGVMSRWHPDDPIGRRLTRTVVKWDYVYHAAINEDGTAFAPHIWPIDELLKVRRELAEQDPSERLWWAQFMNQPFVPGREIFGEPARYYELPDWPGFRDGIGVDMSYTASKSADHFALVVGRSYGGSVFLKHFVRMHADLNEMETQIRAAWERFGRCSIYTYFSGPERGAIDHLLMRGIPVQGMHARYNKGIRAQATRALWNTSKLLVPLGDDWAPFVRRVRSFRGAENDADDELDAMVSLVDGMVGSAVSAPKAMGASRMA